MIGHFELFGLERVFKHLRGQAEAPATFKTPGFYGLVRHPLMTGFIIAFWATPTMTQGHLLFAAVTTAYILIAIQLEERDLIGYFGDRYRQYRKDVSMLIPLPRKRS
jgi:protein-S-isoprenylcysteine O-methyltransferase Ste14